MAGGSRVEGLNQVVRELQAVGVDLDDLKDAFGDIAAQGARAAERFTPRGTGRLAGTTRGNRAKNKAVITQGRASVPYAGPINYGWRRRGIRGALQMQKADKQMEPVAVQKLEANIDQVIRKRGLT